MKKKQSWLNKRGIREADNDRFGGDACVMGARLIAEPRATTPTIYIQKRLNG